MPLYGRCEKDDAIAHEEATSTLHAILLLLLRGGARGYIHFIRTMRRCALSASKTSSSALPSASHPRPVASPATTTAVEAAATAAQRNTRMYPQDLRNTLSAHGVMLSSSQYSVLHRAFADAVDFIRVEPLQRALGPLSMLKLYVNDSDSEASGGGVTSVDMLLHQLIKMNRDSVTASSSCVRTAELTQPDEEMHLCVSSVRCVLSAFFTHDATAHAHEQHEDTNESCCRSNSNNNNNSNSYKKSSTDATSACWGREKSRVLCALNLGHTEAMSCFTQEHYIETGVPFEDVRDFVAAWLLLYLDFPTPPSASPATLSSVAFVRHLLHVLSTRAAEMEERLVIHAHVPTTQNEISKASRTKFAATSTTRTNSSCVTNGDAYRQMATIADLPGHVTSHYSCPSSPLPVPSSLPSQCTGDDAKRQQAIHCTAQQTTGSTFARYCAHEDRRDAWLRGTTATTAANEPGPMYGKHAAGYAGHLPEYRYHFGRPFHVIEEDLPQLTRQRSPPSLWQRDAL